MHAFSDAFDFESEFWNCWEPWDLSDKSNIEISLLQPPRDLPPGTVWGMSRFEEIAGLDLRKTHSPLWHCGIAEKVEIGAVSTTR